MNNNLSLSKVRNNAVIHSEEYKDAKIFTLPAIGKNTNVACAWQSGSRFTIYPRDTASTEQNNTKQRAPCDSVIHNIRQEVILYSPSLRKLVNESNGTFLALQTLIQKCGTSESNIELLKLSRQYRSVIRACLESLQESANSENSGHEEDNIQNLVTIFYSIECIWHLCEILYIEEVPGDVVLPHILEWVRFHFPRHEQSATQILEECMRGSETRDDYWGTVTGMIIQGRVDVARALLKLHSSAESNPFKLMDNTLRTMPLYSVYSGVSAGEFTISWKHWQVECKSKINAKAFQTERKLELIMKLLAGDYSVFEQVRESYESWYDVLGGWLLCVEPTARRHELGRHAHACADMRGGERTAPRPLDDILLALMDGELHQVINDIQNMTDNGWFATHLTDLLFHCGKLTVHDKHQINVTGQLRESLIMDYGSRLMDHHSLWPVGLSYLACCPGEGLKRAYLLLERLPLGNEKRIMKILHEAEKHNLHGIVRDTCSVQGFRCLQQYRPGCALAWALRGHCASLATRVADTLLQEYTRSGQLACTDLLLTLGPAMLLSDRLVFLGKYCEFHKLYSARQFKEAGALLISLMTSKITPKYFWSTLLLDILPLLESDEIIFSANDTFEIMRCLEENGEGLEQNDKSELRRLALVRNLARTLVGEHNEEQEEKD